MLKLLYGGVPLDHKLAGDQLAGEYVDVGVEDAAVVEDAGPLHAVPGVDVDLGPELHSPEGPVLGAAVQLHLDCAVDQPEVLADVELAELVGEVEVGPPHLLLQPHHEPRLSALRLDRLPQLLPVYHCLTFIFDYHKLQYEQGRWIGFANAEGIGGQVVSRPIIRRK